MSVDLAGRSPKVASVAIGRLLQIEPSVSQGPRKLRTEDCL